MLGSIKKAKMDQHSFRKSFWRDSDDFEPNPFSKKSLPLLKRKGCQTLLDVGCGNGRDSVYFAQNGLQVTALDFSESGIQRLQEKAEERGLPLIRPVCSDLRRLDFDPESFDAVYAHLSLHYFNDAQTTQLFADLFRILKKDGLLLVKCKSVDDPLYGQGQELEKDMYEQEGYVRHFFSEGYLRQKLDKFDTLSIESSSDQYHGRRHCFVEGAGRKK